MLKNNVRVKVTEKPIAVSFDYKEIGTCEYCGDSIFEGDEHYDIKGELVHWGCLRDWASEYRR